MNETTTTFDQLQEQHHAVSRDSLARAIWSTIIEPGDQDAGELIGSLSAAEALEAVLFGESDSIDEEKLGSLRERVIPKFSTGAVEIAFRSAARFGAELVTPEHPHWPTRMNDLGNSAPVALWVRGNTECLVDEASTAIVGARAATGYGEHVTMEIAAGLVGRGHTIVSGAAYGIDGMAHRAALASSGHTVAYLAGGVDRFYPSGHDALLARIVEAGVVASELPCGSAPTKWRFLMRNRLIAASTKATLVVEAGWRSGSLNVAGHAVALDRALGAVPGPVTSAASAGCHRLIRDFGATLVTTAEEAAEL
jgi:DNA processing protein